MSELTIEQRVAAGVAWLDDYQADWLDRIDPEVLNVESCDRCVLGQIYGTYGHAPEVAKYDDDRGDEWDAPARERGFEAYSLSDEEYAALTVEWRRVIESRRAES